MQKQFLSTRSFSLPSSRLYHALRLRVSRQRLRQQTTIGLVLALACFVCIPRAWGQQQNSSSPQAVSASTKSPETAPPPLPVPSSKQAIRAEELFRKGTDALRKQKSQRAVQLFAAAHRLSPGNGIYLAAYEIARQQQIGGILHAAKEDQTQGKSALAKKKLLAALSLDPGNPYVQQHLRSLAPDEEPAVVSSMPLPRFSSGLVELAPTPVRATFHLHGNAQQIVKKVFEAYGITPLLDDSVTTKDVRFDLTDVPYAGAATALELATNTFLVPLDPEHVVVAADTKANRAKFERLLLETVFLPGLDAKAMSEPMNLIKNVFGVRQISVRAGTGALSIRAPEATLRAINATLAHLYLDKPQIMLDVRVYQVTNSSQEKLGVAFPQAVDVFNVTSELTGILNSNQATISQLIASGLVNPGDYAGIAALLVGLGLVNGTVFNQPFALFGGGLTQSGLSFGGATANASLNISNTRQLDHVQLRAGDAEKQSLLIGSRYPIVTQSYSAGTQIPTGSTSLTSLMAGASPASATSTSALSYAPTVQYQDLGLTVKALPRVLSRKEVQIQLEVKISSLAGASVDGSPILNNRSFTTTIQVPNGGSALIASSVSRTESKSISGIPGLSELPGFAWTASPATQLTIGKLLIVIQPRILSAQDWSVATKMLPLPPGTATP